MIDWMVILKHLVYLDHIDRGKGRRNKLLNALMSALEREIQMGEFTVS